jgi:AcrR family transcriptional regulator
MTVEKTAPLATRRRERSRLAILDAALALCREEGYGKLSVEAIAARAGASKQTIYRWWPSKGFVLLEALEREVAGSASVPDTGDIVADMRTLVGALIRRHADPNFGPHVAALIAESQHDPALGRAAFERFVKGRRTPIVERLRRAQQAGQLPASLDPGAVLEVVFGALYHRLLLRSGPLDAAYGSFVVDVVFVGSAARRRPRPLPLGP